MAKRILFRGGKIVFRDGRIVFVEEGQAGECPCCRGHNCCACGSCCYSTVSWIRFVFDPGVAVAARTGLGSPTQEVADKLAEIINDGEVLLYPVGDDEADPPADCAEWADGLGRLAWRRAWHVYTEDIGGGDYRHHYLQVLARRTCSLDNWQADINIHSTSIVTSSATPPEATGPAGVPVGLPSTGTNRLQVPNFGTGSGDLSNSCCGGAFDTGESEG
jgi:hypothetical protein